MKNGPFRPSVPAIVDDPKGHGEFLFDFLSLLLDGGKSTTEAPRRELASGGGRCSLEITRSRRFPG